MITMPYYYVKIMYFSKNTGFLESIGGYNMSEEGVRQLVVEHFLNDVPFVFLGKVIDPKLVEEIHIYETGKKIEDILFEQRRKRSTRFGSVIYENLSGSVDEVLEGICEGEIGKDVTSQFITSLPKVSERKRVLKKLGRNVFIVHGRDIEPVKELKAMLNEIGLNPIVLHEQPSGSRTIVEKLERYSDVGYAFVILSPDDLALPDTLPIIPPLPPELPFKHRARQNVVLEFGYFMGLLGRDRVCCLYKGDVELPSDMHGIVYIPFKESVEECRHKIIKELKAAGYEIKNVNRAKTGLK